MTTPTIRIAALLLALTVILSACDGTPSDPSATDSRVASESTDGTPTVTPRDTEATTVTPQATEPSSDPTTATTAPTPTASDPTPTPTPSLPETTPVTDPEEDPALLDPDAMTKRVVREDFTVNIHPEWKEDRTARPGTSITYLYPFDSARASHFMISAYPIPDTTIAAGDHAAMIDRTIDALYEDPGIMMSAEPEVEGSGKGRHARVRFEQFDPDDPETFAWRFSVQAEIRLTDTSVVFISVVGQDAIRPEMLEAWEALIASFTPVAPEAAATPSPAADLGPYDLSAVSTLGPVLFYYDPSWTITYGDSEDRAVYFTPYDDMADGLFLLQLRENPAGDPKTALQYYADSLAADPGIDEMESLGMTEDEEGRLVLRYRTVIRLADGVYTHYNLARVAGDDYIILEGAVRGAVTPAWEDLAETLFAKISHRQDPG